MKRREFLQSSAGLAGVMIPALGLAESRPCPPDGLKVVGGGAAGSSACGGSAVSFAPKWFQDLPERIWVEVAAGESRTDLPAERRGQRLHDVRVIPDAGSSVGLQGNGWKPTISWTGGAVDQERRELILAANGGHTDGVDNGVYICRLGDSIPRWHRAVDPTPDPFLVGFTGAIQRNGAGVYGDGRPRSVHGWHKQSFGGGRVWYVGQDSTALSSGFSTAIFSWRRSYLPEDPSQWPVTHPSVRNVKPELDLGGWQYHGQSGQRTGDDIWYGPSCFDPVRQQVWTFSGYSDGTRYWSVDAADGPALSVVPAVTTNSPLCTRFSDTLGSAARFSGMWAVCAHDVFGKGNPGIVVVPSYRKSTVYILDLRDPSRGMTVRDTGSVKWDMVGATTAGDGFAPRYGAVYHPQSRGILVYDPSLGLGGKVRLMRVPAEPIDGTYAWETLEPADGSVDVRYPTNFRGAFSKFNMINDMGNGQSALVLVTDVKGPVYVYKLPKSGL